MKFQGLQMQNFKHLAQPNLERMGERKMSGFVPLFSTCCWTVIRCSWKGEDWLCARLVVGLPGAGWGENMHLPALEPRMSQGPTPTRWPPPQCAVQSNQQFTGGMAIKGQLHTNFLKPKNIFHGVEHFSSVFSSVKAVTFCSNRSSI